MIAHLHPLATSPPAAWLGLQPPVGLRAGQVARLLGDRVAGGGAG